MNIRVAINGCVCDTETWDTILETDGKRDEIFFTWSVSTNASTTGGQSGTYGDTNGFPNRIRAGSASAAGGIKTGDIIPAFVPGAVIPRLPWWPTPADGFPIVLWEGDVNAEGPIKIAPLVWERDGSGVDPGPIIEVINQVAVAISTAVGYGAIGGAIGVAVTEIATHIGVAGDRPIGMDISNPDPSKNDWPRLELTADNIDGVLNKEFLGKGILMMEQRDPPGIGGGVYRFFVQVSRL